MLSTMPHPLTHVLLSLAECVNTLTSRTRREAGTTSAEHGNVKNDSDVHEWAAPEFLEQAASRTDRGTLAEGDRGEASRGD